MLLEGSLENLFPQEKSTTCRIKCFMCTLTVWRHYTELTTVDCGLSVSSSARFVCSFVSSGSLLEGWVKKGRGFRNDESIHLIQWQYEDSCFSYMECTTRLSHKSTSRILGYDISYSSMQYLHLVLNFYDLKSIISVLNYLHLRLL
jgi:hypothetical protein